MKTKYVKLQDGDNLSVIVETPPTVFDPTGSVVGVAQVYRVVATSFDPTLDLVPLGTKPVKLSNIPEEDWSNS